MGREFLNDQVEGILRSQVPTAIEHFSTLSDMKAAVVERFNRKLKTRMWQYFTEHQTHQYLDLLPRLVDAYNRSLHRSIGTTPPKVHRRASSAVIERMRIKFYAKARSGIGGGGGAHCTRNKQSL